MSEHIAVKPISSQDMNQTLFINNPTDNSLLNQSTSRLNTSSRFQNSVQFSMSSYSQVDGQDKGKRLAISPNKLSESFETKREEKALQKFERIRK